MSPIAVFYHAKISGSGIPDPMLALGIACEQMLALKQSSLADAAREIHVGINGGSSDAMDMAQIVPDKTELHIHGNDSRTELSTLSVLRRWLDGHAGWSVLYHHTKGVTNPNDDFHHHHRRTMESQNIWKWKQCVEDLDRGYDAVGINWVDPITRPVLPGRFFAGNFWWARSNFLKDLPGIPEFSRDYNLLERIKAEGWIGSGSRRPMVLDYERPQLSAWCRDMLISHL